MGKHIVMKFSANINGFSKIAMDSKVVVVGIGVLFYFCLHIVSAAPQARQRASVQRAPAPVGGHHCEDCHCQCSSKSSARSSGKLDGNCHRY